MALANLCQPRKDRHDAPVASPVLTLADIHRGFANHEFEPLFQAKVELAAGRVKGVEAFARWCRPEHGILSLLVFIPVLEELGEMQAFSRIVIEKSIVACFH